MFDLSNLKKDQELKNQQFSDFKLDHSKQHDMHAKQDDGWGKFGSTPSGFAFPQQPQPQMYGAFPQSQPFGMGI